MKLLFFLSFSLFIHSLCLAQPSSIQGRLKLATQEDEKFLSKRITITLKGKSKIDSAIVDNNLEFVFQGVEDSVVSLAITPRSYPTQMRYRLHVNPGEIKNIELDYSPVCPYSTSGTITRCPTCRKKNKVIPIEYGLIFHTKRRHKEYFRGGCVVHDCQPSWHCKRDKTKF